MIIIKYLIIPTSRQNTLNPLLWIEGKLKIIFISAE